MRHSNGLGRSEAAELRPAQRSLEQFNTCTVYFSTMLKCYSNAETVLETVGQEASQEESQTRSSSEGRSQYHQGEGHHEASTCDNHSTSVVHPATFAQRCCRDSFVQSESNIETPAGIRTAREQDRVRQEWRCPPRRRYPSWSTPYRYSNVEKIPTRQFGDPMVELAKRLQ